MTQLNEYETRLQRLEQLKSAWVIPYANKYNKQYSIQHLKEIGADTTNLADGDVLLQQWAQQSYSTAWRMMSFRTMGKLSFASLRDHTGDIQVCFVKNLCTLYTWKEQVETIHIDGHDRSAYKFVEKFLDIGDFIWVKGELFVTKHGELTLFVDEYQLLSKALRPLWDKWHGIQDEEKKYRQRYLDMTMNEESYRTMQIRSIFIKALREFYRSYDFVELDTPILGNSASGAAATPFVTHHEDFDLDMYLRIAPEIALKMATVGRLERVFEIGKDFRNEGSSPSHHQEFTVAEHYATYWNFEDNIRFTEAMFDYLFDAIPELSKKVVIADKEWVEREVDFTTPWERVDYTAQVKKDSGIDVSLYGSDDEEKLRTDIKDAWYTWEWIDAQTTATMIDYLYKKVTRLNIIWPAFIYNYPKTMQPLARQSDDNPRVVEQFQAVVNGREILKAYSELVDPVIQQANFDEQADAAASWDSEATKSDDAFVRCMQHGMPPQSWRGMGIDRILSLLLWKTNIRDVIMFPLMKPEYHQDIAMGASKKTKIAVALVNTWAGMHSWQEMNTIAHLNAAFGARVGKSLFTQDDITTHDGHHINLNIQHAIMIKQAPDAKTLIALSHLAKESNLEVAEFTREMLETTDDKKIIEQTWSKDHHDVEYLWLLLFGDKKEVEKLTEKYDLYTDSSASSENIVKGALPISTSTTFPSREQVYALVEKYLSDSTRHCQQVGDIMHSFAKILWYDEETQHVRYTTGVLHDIDRDIVNKDMHHHMWERFLDIMAEIDAPQSLIDDIRSHYTEKWYAPVDSEIRKYLVAVDELSGFLHAYSLMRPEGYTGMKRKSINKKLKDKKFAAWVSRDHVKYCEIYLDIPVNEFAITVANIMAWLYNND